MTTESLAMVARGSRAARAVFDGVGAFEAAVGETPDRSADDALGVGEELFHGSDDAFAPAPGAELGDPFLGEPVGRQLRTQVASALVRVPHARDERGQGCVVESRWRDDDSLLVERSRPRRQAPRL
jgi:hypothetical protein